MATARQWQANNNLKNELSLSYPFNWEGLERFHYRLDDNGIPLVHMGRTVGLRYNPITIAQFGLFNLQQYAEHHAPNNLATVQKTVSWLVRNCQSWRSEIGAWVFDYSLDFYGPEAPWISGMAQGQGISLLLRAYPLVSDKKVLNLSHQAFEAFLHPVSAGGVVSHFPDGSIVFEEFPTVPPSLVLNGHMFALLGIHDYATYWRDKSALGLFEVAIQGLRSNVERYDTGCWNVYDLHPSRRLASPMYIRVHVQLLRILGNLSGEGFFYEVAETWQRYLRHPVCRLRWLLGKLIEKIRLKL